MEAIYQRYASLVQQYGGEPVSLEVFALTLLGDFLEWERLSKVYETPMGAMGRGNYFGLYIRKMRSAKPNKKRSAAENAWISYQAEIAKHPAATSWGDPATLAESQEHDIARAKQTQAEKKPWGKRRVRDGSRSSQHREIPPPPLTEESEQITQLTEEQQREVDIARQYEPYPATFAAFIQVLGYNPLTRYRKV